MATVIDFPRGGSDVGDGADRLDLTATTLGALRMLVGQFATCVAALEVDAEARPGSARTVVAPRTAYALPAPGAPVPQDVRSAMRHDWHARWQLFQAAKHDLKAAQIRAGWEFEGNWQRDKLIADRDRAAIAYSDACLNLMMTPAWSRQCLAWKLSQVEFLAGYHERHWKRVLRADRARLLPRSKGSLAAS